MGSEPIGDRFQVGSPVHICGGAFAGMDGQVVAIFPEEGHADVRIAVFGREIDVTVRLDWLRPTPSSSG